MRRWWRERPDFSVTNVQEIGVDEPEPRKTDGEPSATRRARHFVDSSGVNRSIALAELVDGGYDAPIFLH